jgi:hypothetical protein
MLDNIATKTAHLEVLTPPKEGSLSRAGNGELIFSPGGDFADMARGETRTVNFDYLRTGVSDSAIGTATIVVRAKDLGPVVDGIEFTDRRTVSRRISFASLCPADEVRPCRITRQPPKGRAVLDRQGDLIFYPQNDFDDLMNGEARIVSLECEVADSKVVRNCIIQLCVQANRYGVSISEFIVKEHGHGKID